MIRSSHRMRIFPVIANRYRWSRARYSACFASSTASLFVDRTVYNAALSWGSSLATEGTPLVGSYLATCCSAMALVNGFVAAAKLRTATIAGVSPGGSIDAAIGTVGAARESSGGVGGRRMLEVASRSQSEIGPKSPTLNACRARFWEIRYATFCLHRV